uniref:hypothetical protein n=1 Tax=Salmonella sp. s51933 TaxID=3160127 RepID=UPI003754D728
EPPKWREDEKEIFSNERDMDKDGKLNREEALKWLFPGNYDPLDSETSHLFSKADDNKDKILTKQEILNNQEVFIGSQATNFGETLNRPIDEL